MSISQVKDLPCRADHVGSLLRPPELLAARAEYQQGRIDAEALRKVEDAAIADVVEMQQAIGLKSITDGEFRRGSWHMDFLYQIGGVIKEEDNIKVQFKNESGVSSLRRPNRVSWKSCGWKKPSSPTPSPI